MPYTEPKSSDVWFNLPGVVAAYQPVAAPDFIAARQNVSANFGRIGQYTATPGTAPTFNPATGWTFTRLSSTYLDTGYSPTPGVCSLICRFTWGGNISFSQALIGNSDDTGAVLLGPRWGANQVIFWNNALLSLATPAYTDGVMALSGVVCYKDGQAVGTASGGTGTNAGRTLYLGASRIKGAPGNPTAHWDGLIQCAALFNRKLSPPEIWQASYQMKYCNQNPDWSAWGQRRKWFIVAQAAGTVGIYGARATMALPGGVSIRPTGGNT